MKAINQWRAILFLLCLLAGAAASSAQDTALFIPTSPEPVVAHSDVRGDWDDRFTDPGAVFYHDGQFHMFRNGFRGWPASVQIGYLTSDDGITWTEQSPDPVLTTDEVPYAEVAALASSGMVMEDGTWVLYFYTWPRSAATGQTTIGRATAASPLGPWTVDPEPLLVAGSEGAWDDAGVLGGRVLPGDDGFVMYYSGANFRHPAYAGVGMATSEDGITWTKYDDPATTGGEFAESDPVFVEQVERTFIHQPSVHVVDGQWVMFYRTAPVGQGDSGMSMRYALSEDGIAWTAPADNAAWLRDTIAEGTSGFWWTASAYHDGTYYLYVEEGSMGGTNIYAGTFSGMFSP
jgi:predicted GH43/DUF377 family glycosyl hydrolase